jgi:hypothetical protein
MEIGKMLAAGQDFDTDILERHPANMSGHGKTEAVREMVLAM